MNDLRAVLADIYQRHGRLSAEIVVEEATADTHPLHNRFVWDDVEAAHNFRLNQATALIRSVRVTFIPGADSDVDVREWHAVRRDGTYDPVEEIVRDDVTTQVLLRQAEREWKALRARYGHLAGFIALVREAVA